MTTAFRASLKTFLEGDVDGQISSMPLASTDVYFGQIPRINRSDSEVWCRYVGSAPQGRGVGNLSRHFVDFELYRCWWDESEEDTLVSTIEASAEELERAYDEQIDVFRAGLSAETIDRVRCVRAETTINRRRERAIRVEFEIDEWSD